MKFRTTVDPGEIPISLDYSGNVLHLGSCFSNHMASQLRLSLFKVAENPFGTTFNPISLASQLEHLLRPSPFRSEHLEFYRGMFFSFEHYSIFSSPDKDQCLAGINRILSKGARALPEATLLMITLGTAHAWKWKKGDRIVNNCHKLPGNEFTKTLIKPEIIIEKLGQSLKQLNTQYPNLQVLITVSPVRHWSDGATANQLSKSHLIMAALELCEQFPHVHYFPAYEIMMDDLRDYRFYSDDLLHPNAQAVQYIWEKFSASILSENAQKAIKEIAPVNSFLNHLPRWPESPEHQKNIDRTLKLIQGLKRKYPAANWALIADHPALARRSS